MLDGARPRALVSGQSFASMVAETPPSITNLAEWYGFGLFLVNQLGGVTWSHGGANYGTRSYFWRFANGIGYAFVFNGDSQDQTSLTNYAGQAIWDALAAVTDWPDQDLFPQYYPPRITASGVVNAASFQPGPLAPGSLSTVFGVDLGGQGADVTASLRDASGAERAVPLLYSGAGQLNGVLPDEAVLGDATLIVHREGWPDAEAPVPIAAVSPGVFQLNAEGLAAASLVRAKPGQAPSWESVYQVDGAGNVTALPIAFTDEDEELWLVLLRYRRARVQRTGASHGASWRLLVTCRLRRSADAISGTRPDQCQASARSRRSWCCQCQGRSGRQRQQRGVVDFPLKAREMRAISPADPAATYAVQ